MLTYGKGKHKVWVECKVIGSDRVYLLGGGETPHIGGVVVCEPGKKARIQHFGRHLDHLVLLPLAEQACKRYNTRVVAVGGIHIQNATKKDIVLVVKHCQQLFKKI